MIIPLRLFLCQGRSSASKPALQIHTWELSSVWQASHTWPENYIKAGASLLPLFYSMLFCLFTKDLHFSGAGSWSAPSLLAFPVISICFVGPKRRRSSNIQGTCAERRGTGMLLGEAPFSNKVSRRNKRSEVWEREGVYSTLSLSILLKCLLLSLT